MDTRVYTPMDVFHLPSYFLVPLFQRPYVWTQEDQWQPLWQDVRRMAELRLHNPATTARHFLGAIVLQAQDASVGQLSTRNVIDGQQRLTTLQLLMDAAAAVLEQAGQDMLAGRLDAFTHNPDNFVASGQPSLKLRHSNQDKAAFDEVMDAEPPVDHDGLIHAGSLVVHAHRYFMDVVQEWVGNSEDQQFPERAAALTDVLSAGLQVVVIDLLATENSQEIFETLNARGTPLTSADLIKNYVFQRLDSEGADVRRAYAEDWPFESPFWDAEVSVGRHSLTRGSLFLNQWLGSRVGEEVSPRTTFNRFKTYVEHESSRPMSELLPVIKKQADLYKAWTLAADDPDRQLDPVEMSVYRMKVSGIELLKPVLIWLFEPGREAPPQSAHQAIAALESWVVRRQLLRLTTADQGRIVAEIIRTNRTRPPEEFGRAVSDHLAALDAVSNYWPGDAEVQAELLSASAYTRYPRARLRMFLEAVEDSLRSRTNQPQVPRRSTYSIEHVLPQKWEASWSVEGLEAQQDRANHVHRLGNLTLLTAALNASVSNGPWNGPTGKRSKMLQHDVFLLNRDFREERGVVWNEERIDERGGELVGEILRVWAVPQGHVGQVADRETAAPSWIDFKDVVVAGLIEPGAILVPRDGKWVNRRAQVRADGRIEIDEREFDTPSGAASYVRGGPSNGWYFWRLEDGTRLTDLRTRYRAQRPREVGGLAFDWSRLHAILERMPVGRWTSYVELAETVGTIAGAVGTHLTTCAQCVNTHRVLTWDGHVATSAHDPQGRVGESLQAEGVAVIDGRADPTKELLGDELVGLLAE